MNMIRTFICAAVLVFAVTGGIGRAAEAPGGLLLTLKVAGVEAVEMTSGVMLQIKEGESASPLLPSGAVSAEWRGFVNADLRGDYRFKAAARGVVTVEINGKVVLNGTGSGPGFVGPSEEVRLNKGGNPLKVTFQGPAEGDAFLRLLWSEQGFLWEPIDPVYLTRGFEAPGLAASEQVLKGRGLFLNRRCVKCHSTNAEGALPELQMDAPSFAGIGSRRNAGWMARWIADPRAERADARMPKLLHGETSREDAAAIAAYLATLTDGSVGFSGESKE
ncbi:MAG: c-type cytochrome, partial [Verrucomicrobiae bacterium]|nr:c-type cytochrome [Verrucomicrobiae bacterium]